MEIGLSTCSKEINEKLFYEYAKNNINYMEISVAHNEYKTLDYEFIKKMADKYNIILWSFHLPFSPFIEIDISSRGLRKKSVKYLKELIDKASSIGISNFVVHPSAEPIINRYRNFRMEYSKESLNELAEYAEAKGSNILCENLPRSCLGKDSSEILDLISINDKLNIVFDTNHLLFEDCIDFLRKTGDKIKSVHISDYDFINERHWLPGEGRINWHDLYQALLDVGYNGPWLYEVSFSTPSNLKRKRDLTCADFAKNANEIFSGSPISLI